MKKIMKEGETYKDMASSGYTAVFRVFGGFGYSFEGTLDQIEGGPLITNKLDAMVAARAFQLVHMRDPNYIIDLTDLSLDELKEIGIYK